MQDRHIHDCVNPSGHVFTIGCFLEARGVEAWGDASRLFSWFPGHAWRVVTCQRCGVHLGWRFEGGEGASPAQFFGLILTRMTRGDAPDGA